MLENMFRAASVILTGQYGRLLNYFFSPLSYGQTHQQILFCIKMLYIAFAGHSFNINVVHFHYFGMYLE